MNFSFHNCITKLLKKNFFTLSTATFLFMTRINTQHKMTATVERAGLMKKSQMWNAFNAIIRILSISKMEFQSNRNQNIDSIFSEDSSSFEMKLEGLEARDIELLITTQSERQNYKYKKFQIRNSFWILHQFQST